MSRRKTITAALLLLIIFLCYYIVLSNKPFIEHLRKTNSFLYALISTVIMLTLGFSIGLTWNLLGNSQRSNKNNAIKDKRKERGGNNDP